MFNTSGEAAAYFGRAKTASDYMAGFDPLDFKDPPSEWVQKPELKPSIISQIGGVMKWGMIGFALGAVVGVAVTVPTIAATVTAAATTLTGTAAAGSAAVGVGSFQAAVIGGGVFAAGRLLFGRKMAGARCVAAGAVAGGLIGACFGFPKIGALVGAWLVAGACEQIADEENTLARKEAKIASWDNYLRSAGDEYPFSSTCMAETYRTLHNERYKARHAEIIKAQHAARSAQLEAAARRTYQAMNGVRMARRSSILDL